MRTSPTLMAGKSQPNGNTVRINGLSGRPYAKPISTMLPSAGGSSRPALSPAPGKGKGTACNGRDAVSVPCSSMSCTSTA
ncbi:hypothetical protein [Pseudoalteromonas obscura]|uniref:hypothetical protein n=1 Tax=Pseudoalteromonas obscura TaxID=3048491 RepID=UPI0024DE1DE0|nr:hypothetical protein [Pseudoalteromonas sp. P94(2023)]